MVARRSLYFYLCLCLYQGLLTSALVGSMAACGGGDSKRDVPPGTGVAGSTRPSGNGACGLMMQGEVDELFGTSVGAGAPELLDNGDLEICTWPAGEDPAFTGNQSVVGNILANLCSITSGLVLRQWGFDSELTLIFENCDESRIVDVNQPISYSDVLQAAVLIAPENFLGGEQQAQDYDSHPLQQKFAAAGIIESRELFLEKADKELAATRELLKT